MSSSPLSPLVSSPQNTIPLSEVDTTSTIVDTTSTTTDNKTKNETITDIASKALKNNQSSDQSTKNFFKRVWSKIVSGFEKIQKCLKKFFDDDDLDIDDLDIDDLDIDDLDIDDIQDYSTSQNLDEQASLDKALELSKKEDPKSTYTKRSIIYDPSKVVPIQRKPVEFDNKANNCWFHAALCMINALDDTFFDLVDQRYQLDKEMHAYLDYKKAVSLYEEQVEAHKDQFNANLSANRIKLLEDQLAWELGDKSTSRPSEDRLAFELNDNLQPPKFVKKPKNAPKKTEKKLLDDKEINLIRALKEYKQALDTDSKIKDKAQNIHDALVILSGAKFGTPGRQEDPAEFLDIIFGLICKGVFSTSMSRKGLSDGKTYYNKPEITHQNKLEIQIPKNTPFSLQEMVDNYFSTEHFRSSSKNPYMEFSAHDKNGNPINNVTQFKSVKSKIRVQDPAPEFFILQAKRFDYEITFAPSMDQIIQHILAELPDNNDPTANVIQGIKDYERLRKHYESYTPKYKEKKINTSIGMPENGLINFAKAFGKKDAEGYEYQITSVIFHYGECDNGHYTAAVQHRDDKTNENVWSHVNDIGQRVKTIKSEDLVNELSSGYIFLLRKVKKEDVVDEESENEESEESINEELDSEISNNTHPQIQTVVTNDETTDETSIAVDEAQGEKVSPQKNSINMKQVLDDFLDHQGSKKTLSESS